MQPVQTVEQNKTARKGERKTSTKKKGEEEDLKGH